MAINRNLSILAQGASSTGNLLNYAGANKIINGDMRIDQRNAGASQAITSSRVYCLDRWCVRGITGSGHTIQQVTDAPVAYKNSLKVTIGTGGTPSASDANYIAQFIEGNQVTDLGFGGASAKTIAVSFWVKSSVTGTFTAPIFNGAYTRSYLATYVVSVANTWEQKSIIIPGDTSGTWVLTSSTGFVIQFDLGSGTSLQNTAGGWYNTEYDGATGATRIITTSGATIQWTGVKIEVGTVATPFVPDDYGTSLAKCQRYFAKWSGVNAIVSLAYQLSSTQGYAVIKLPVSLRAAATIAYTGTPKMDFAGSSGSINGMSQAGGYGPMFDTQWIYATSTGLAAGNGVCGILTCATNGVVTLDAEL